MDVLNKNNTVYEWTNTKRSTPTGNFIIKLKFKYLKSFNDNYFTITTNKITLASYLISLEDPIDSAPQITVATNPLRYNEPVKFEIRVKPASNSMIRVDFGDGVINLFEIISNSTNELATPYTIKLEHLFPQTGLEFTIRCKMANHISKTEANKTILFEASLAKFSLVALSNITELSQTVTFKLTPLGRFN